LSILKLLSEKEFSGKVRKYYSITKEGKGMLNKKMDEWQEYATAVQNVLVMGV